MSKLSKEEIIELLPKLANTNVVSAIYLAGNINNHAEYKFDGEWYNIPEEETVLGLLDRGFDIRVLVTREKIWVRDVTKNCEACKGTGYYGDMGPGIKGNYEYCPCDQCPKIKIDQEPIIISTEVLSK